MPVDDEFQEIAHCGGKIAIHTKVEDGELTYSVGYSSSNPTPMSIFGIYALAQGNPVGDCPFGWLNHPDAKPPIPGCIPVFIASDQQGYFGHQCQLGCKGYWRSTCAPHLWPMTCPYCGHRDRTYQFVTDAHIRYTQHYINKLMDALNETVEEQELVIDMDELRDANIDVPKQNFYYAEESQQCRFQCEACGIHNDILGNYGYCSCCGTRNNLQLVRQIIADHQVKGMSLRDLVSVIESCGRDYVQQLVNNIHMTPRRRRHVKQIRFHDIERASNEIKTFFDIDLFHRINGDDKKFAKLMFLRRNVYEHNSGRADAKYIEKSGDTSVKIGQALRESKGSIERLVPITLKMMENLHAGFHSILPPVQKALEIMNPSSLATKK